MTPRWSFALAAPLLLGGCAVRATVDGSAYPVALPPAFDLACVPTAIARVPQVTNVARAQGEKDPSWRYAFIIPGKRYPRYAEITLYTSNGATGYRHSHTHITHHPHRAFAAFEPLMLAIDRQIARDCGILLEGRVEVSRRMMTQPF